LEFTATDTSLSDAVKKYTVACSRIYTVNHWPLYRAALVDNIWQIPILALTKWNCNIHHNNEYNDYNLLMFVDKMKIMIRIRLGDDDNE